MDFALIFGVFAVFMGIAYSLGMHNGWDMHKSKLKNRKQKTNKIEPVEIKRTAI